MAQNTNVVAQPIAQPDDPRALAPWPMTDKSPIVIGPGLSLSYISAIFRLSLLGYRQQYVDLLDEMLEKELHGFSVLRKRVEAVAGGRLEVVPAKTAPGATNDAALATELAVMCQEMVDNIPDLDQHLENLLWALYYALTACEIHWTRDGAGWMTDRLSFIHSRRLSYPAAGSWDLYIWDQGPVLPGSSFGFAPTNRNTFGLRVADAPGKFVVFAPQMRGNYPTREALGRQMAYWMALKLVAARNAPQYLERFVKPIPEAVYRTGDEATRVANQDDIANAEKAVEQMGAGALSGWVHADTVTLNLRTPDTQGTPKITYKEWIEICDTQMSKGVLGGTLSTDVSTNGGSRALGETQKKSEGTAAKQDAKKLAAAIRRDLIGPMVILNRPGIPRRLWPQVIIHVEDAPDPSAIIDRAVKAAQGGIPVDADKVAEQAGVPVVAPGDLKARRMFPILGQKTPQAFDADLAARAELLAPEPVEDEEQAPGADPPSGDEPPDDEPEDDDEDET